MLRCQRQWAQTHGIIECLGNWVNAKIHPGFRGHCNPIIKNRCKPRKPIAFHCIEAHWKRMHTGHRSVPRHTGSPMQVKVAGAMWRVGVGRPSSLSYHPSLGSCSWKMEACIFLETFGAFSTSEFHSLFKCALLRGARTKRSFMEINT